jgi:MFS transporter, SHS family, lactate transporter
LLTERRPFIVNNLLFVVLELGTGFVSNYNSFLAVRALFGVAMGGLYGNAAATALEDCPHEARGLVSVPSWWPASSQN